MVFLTFFGASFLRHAAALAGNLFQFPTLLCRNFSVNDHFM